MDAEKIHQNKMEALKGAWDAAKKNTDYSSHLIQLHRNQLLEIKADHDPTINHVRIVASGPGGRICPACKELDEKVFSLHKELYNQTLPNPACTCTAYDEEQKGFCLCYYEPVFDDEL